MKFVVAAFALLLIATPTLAETLTNGDIITLTKAGLGSEAITAKIQASANNFDTSTGQLLALKQAGVSDAVIAAMLRASTGATVSQNAVGDTSTSPDPRAPHASGIYLLDESTASAKMRRIDPTIGNEVKTTGVLAYALTYGIAPVKFKTVLPNETARVHSYGGRPVFYFYFNRTGTQLSGNDVGGIWLPGAITSPNEFSLVRFDVGRGDRETVLGQFNITGAKAGVMDKARVAFTYDDVAPGVFRVTPATDLPPGEYGFVYSSGGGGYGRLAGSPSARIFDFSVSADPLPPRAAPTSSPDERATAEAPSPQPSPTHPQCGAIQQPNGTTKLVRCN